MSAFKSIRGALAYSLHRPYYPETLINLACSNISHNGQALDVACGSGQLTRALSERIAHVIGIDRSEAQLQKALQGPNVEYKYGTAEKFPLADTSCDLITVAQALHWFNLDLFFEEVDRVLKSNGRLAVFGYGMCTIENPELDALFQRYYLDTLGSSKEPGELGCYWDISRPLVDSGLEGIKFPYGTVIREWETITKPTTLTDFVGYLSSFSAYEKFLESNKDPLPPLQKSLMDLGWNGEVNVSRPFFLLLSQKP